MRRVTLAPEQGWISVVLLLLLAFLLGLCIDDSAWVLGTESLTDFLPWAALGGAIAGVAGGLLAIGRWRSHLLGAIAAAIVVPILVGSIFVEGNASFLELIQETAEGTFRAIGDLVVNGRGSTHEYAHFLLTLGLFLWGTAMFAGYAAFGHRRAVPAVLALGIPVLVNVTITGQAHEQTQYAFLIVGSLLALLLLVRLHAFDERLDWLRRRIGDPGPIEALTARGGTVFAAFAVAGALMLTHVASSAPLRDAWVGAEPWLVDIGRELQKYFTFLNSPRGPASVDFGPNADLRTTWTSDPKAMLTVTLPAGNDYPYYWRSTTYDEYTGSGWISNGGARSDRDAGTELLAGTLEATDPTAGRQAVTYTVTPLAYKGRELLAAADPATIDQDATLVTTDEGGSLSSIVLERGGQPYRVTSLLRTVGDADPAAITANKLRAAGRDYPTEIRDRYLQLPPGALGPEAEAFLLEVQQTQRVATDYDLVVALEARFKGQEFDYDTDISDVNCGDRSSVECFVHFRQGFCQWYATAMTVMLRAADVPARFVQGFLPGELQADGSRVVRASDSHAWVEVYFPGYGWVQFDPTGNNVSQLPPLPAGTIQPLPSQSPVPSRGPDDDGELNRTPSAQPGGGGSSGTPSGPVGPGPFILVGLVLAAVVGWAAFMAYRRGPRDVSPDQAWTSVTGLARRLGFGPRPTQTVYEYAASLGEVLPSIEPELQTVARAKVEVAYGHRVLGADRLRAVRVATGRLRVGLLRLVLRRRDRRR